MDNGAVGFGGLTPGEDSDTGGTGVPAESVREEASESVHEAAREAGERIRQGAEEIQAIRAIEVEQGKRKGAVASGLSRVVQNPFVTGSLLETVVDRAIKRAEDMSAEAAREVRRRFPLSIEAQQFLGITPGGGIAANDSTYGKDDAGEDDLAA